MEFMTYTADSHQGAIKTLKLHFLGADMLSIFIIQSVIGVSCCNYSCVSDVSFRKQESGDGMRSLDLPYVGEDEALS